MILMGVSVAEQTLVFLYSCGMGFILGLLYDAFRIVRRSFFSKSIFVLIQDLLFWIMSAFLTFVFVLSVNHGEVRGYIFLGEIIGFVIYYFTFSSLVLKFGSGLVNFIKKILLWALNLLFIPFRIIYEEILKIANKIKKIIASFTKKNNLKSKIVLKLRRCLLYNLFKVNRNENIASSKDDSFENW